MPELNINALMPHSQHIVMVSQWPRHALCPPGQNHVTLNIAAGIEEIFTCVLQADAGFTGFHTIALDEVCRT